MKVKRIIEIEEYHIKELQEYCKGEHHGQLRFEIISSAFSSIAHSIPYNPSGDCISREALRKEIDKMPNANPSYWHKCDVVDRQDVLDEIDNAPTVEHSLLPLSSEADNAYMRGYEVGKAEGILKANTRLQGEWIPKRLWDNTHIWVCSECGNQNKHGITVEKACWKCGADMRGGAE